MKTGKKGIKIILSLCIILFLSNTFFLHGMKPYSHYKDYYYENNFSKKSISHLNTTNCVSQSFTARGNILNNISLYLTDTPNQTIQIVLSNQHGKELTSNTFALNNYRANEWNQFPIHSEKLKRNEQYNLVISSENNLSALILSTDKAPIIFTGCTSDHNAMDGNLAAAFQFTYRYMSLGGIFEFLLRFTFMILIILAICYTICNFELLYDTFCHAKTKRGFFYALYFSISLTLLYNPLESLRNEVSKFDRVIGWSLAINNDISKRIRNFSLWFILLALFFALFYLLFHHFLSKEAESEEAAKARSFMDQLAVLANCNLLLRCITYFADSSTSYTVYYFSSYVIMLIMTALLAYVIMKLDKNITLDEYLKLLLTAACVSYPIAISISLEWEEGRVLLGIMAVCFAFILVFCKYAGKWMQSNQLKWISTSSVIIGSLFPVVTSVFIELIHVLNQYSIFIAHPAQLYMIVALVMPGIGFVLYCFLRWKSQMIPNWKKFVYPVFVFGAACLSVQISIQSTYNVDIFESANYSVLIHDFFNFGRIPIIEHYGGHMMTDVWEGILYGIVNSDYAGAVVSPYSSISTPFLAVLFFYFIKNAWSEDIAFFATLLFPFMPYWTYYGFGFLVCLAVISYVRKNSYLHALALWAAIFFCATYRLDLGYAFGCAAVVSLILYALSMRNLSFLKQPFLTLIGFGIVCGVVWSSVCIVKGIQPIDRLIEFLTLSLSNQNWATGSIGNNSISVFSWSYILIPFFVVICLVCTIFSKDMKHQNGDVKWILLLLLGFSYLFNFSRGLVRHSLAEGFSFTIIWSSYIFLSMFVSCLKNNDKLLVPTYMLLILCHTLLNQNDNFTSAPIADMAMSKPTSIIESWKAGRFDEEAYTESVYERDKPSAKDSHFTTYWEKLEKGKVVVNRVILKEDTKNTIDAYSLVLNALLDESETFVDFMNRTSIYPLLGKETPTYVSQSPLQLSGEFAQEQFIKEIEGVPIVLMPLDSENDCRSSASDAIANTYRYYKVAEYIYQNYVPLCRYEDLYAVWCLTDRYQDFQARIETLANGTDYSKQLADCDKFLLVDASLTKNPDGTCTMISTGIDPMLCDLHKAIDTSRYIGTDVIIRVRYSTNMPGIMQLFYTTKKSEDYNTDKVVTAQITGTGYADFAIPITAYTRLRLDIPENSTVTILSLGVKKYMCDYIDYGYDGPFETTHLTEYISYIHNYNHLEQLPRIWSEHDTKKSVNNNVIANLTYQKGLFCLDTNKTVASENGNYLKIHATYDGTDTEGFYRDDDEILPITIIAGNYQNGQFFERCRFGIHLCEGSHDYLIRISADYYWYLKEINAIQFQADETVYDIHMQILEGD